MSKNLNQIDWSEHSKHFFNEDDLVSQDLMSQMIEDPFEKQRKLGVFSFKATNNE